MPAQRVIEDDYTFKDAVVLGNLLISILRRSDRVKMACIAQLVNVIAPIRAEANQPAWRQTIFFPFAYTSKFGRGKTLITRVDSPRIKSVRFGDVQSIDAITTFDEKSNQLAVFAVNRSLTETLETSILLSGFRNIKLLDQVTMASNDLLATNNAKHPSNVEPSYEKSAVVEGNIASVKLSPASWQVLSFSVESTD